MLSRKYWVYVIVGVFFSFLLGPTEVFAKSFSREKIKGKKTGWKDRGLPPGVAKKQSKNSNWGKKRIKPNFYYYPDYQTYYNNRTHKWFWLENGSWQIGYELPKWIRTKRTSRIPINSDSVTPFYFHGEIVARYPPDDRVWRRIRKHQGPPDHAPAWGWRRKRGHDYYFYPGNEVWYDRHSKNYIWLEFGKWKVGVELPRSIKLNEKAKIKFDF